MSKRNWDRVQNQRPEDSIQYRDVYDDQQLERSKIQKKQSPVSRTIFALLVAIVVFFAVYMACTMAEFVRASFMSSSSATTESSDGSEQQGVLWDTSVEVDTAGIDATYDELESFAHTYGYDSEIEVIDGVNTHTGYWSTAAYRYDDTATYPNRMTDDEMRALCIRYKGLQRMQDNGDLEEGTIDSGSVTLSDCMGPTVPKMLLSLLAALAVFGIMHPILMRNLDAQNLMSDTSDINQYPNDQHIALPEEIQHKFDWFPDAGAHCNVQVSSMISHMALSNKGLKSVMVAQRAKEDILDEDGDVEYLKGEVLLDDEGNPIMKRMPMMDEKYMDDLFTASGSPPATKRTGIGKVFAKLFRIPDNNHYRKYYDATGIIYNPDGKSRTKQGGTHKTVADMINADWEFPAYEVQRPGGAYLVDTEPVNTMVLKNDTKHGTFGVNPITQGCV